MALFPEVYNAVQFLAAFVILSSTCTLHSNSHFSISPSMLVTTGYCLIIHCMLCYWMISKWSEKYLSLADHSFISSWSPGFRSKHLLKS
jgi:hypothetical protein